MSEPLVRGTMIHEFIHRAQHVHAMTLSRPDKEEQAELAIQCLSTASFEDDDGDTTYNQGGGGPRIISKKPHVSIPRVWVIRYIPGGGDGPAVNVEIGELEVICDYDTDDDAWKDCPDADKENASES